jgi:hypothetical protein
VQCPTCEAIFIAEVDAQSAAMSPGEQETVAGGGDAFARRQEYRPSVGHYLMPHRGGLILGLGIASVAICFPLGLPFGLCAYLMAANDLRVMREGRMDQAGEGNTQAGQVCGVIGAVIMVLGCCGVGSPMWFGRF